MPLSDEHIPTSELRDRIIRDTVMPKLADCSSEAGYPKTFKGLTRVRGKDVESFGDPTGFWTIRLIVRRTHNEDRKVFRVQALTPRHTATGFCGFLLKGEILQDEDNIQVKASTWTGLYNGTGGENWA